MITSEIKSRLNTIIDESIQEEDASLSLIDKLHIILSESIVALEYVTSIEEEFDVEFDDDDIDLAFFLDLEEVVLKIKDQLTKIKN